LKILQQGGVAVMKKRTVLPEDRISARQMGEFARLLEERGINNHLFQKYFVEDINGLMRQLLIGMCFDACIKTELPTDVTMSAKIWLSVELLPRSITDGIVDFFHFLAGFSVHSYYVDGAYPTGDFPHTGEDCHPDCDTVTVLFQEVVAKNLSYYAKEGSATEEWDMDFVMPNPDYKGKRFFPKRKLY
jgi:hypothetical protein